MIMMVALLTTSRGVLISSLTLGLGESFTRAVQELSMTPVSLRLRLWQSLWRLIIGSTMVDIVSPMRYNIRVTGMAQTIVRDALKEDERRTKLNGHADPRGPENEHLQIMFDGQDVTTTIDPWGIKSLILGQLTQVDLDNDWLRVQTPQGESIMATKAIMVVKPGLHLTAYEYSRMPSAQAVGHTQITHTSGWSQVREGIEEIWEQLHYWDPLMTIEVHQPSDGLRCLLHKNHILHVVPPVTGKTTIQT